MAVFPIISSYPPSSTTENMLKVLRDEEAERKKKEAEEARRLDEQKEFAKLGLALHHELIPLLDGQNIDFGSATVEISNKEIDTTVRSVDGQAVPYRFHSDLSELNSDGQAARTTLLDSTLQDPLTFPSRITPDSSQVNIRSLVVLDAKHFSQVDTKFNLSQNTFDTTVKNEKGEQKHTFHSSVTHNGYGHNSNIETSFYDSATHQLRIVWCHSHDTGDNQLEVNCRPVR